MCLVQEGQLGKVIGLLTSKSKSRTRTRTRTKSSNASMKGGEMSLLRWGSGVLWKGGEGEGESVLDEELESA